MKNDVVKIMNKMATSRILRNPAVQKIRPNEPSCIDFVQRPKVSSQKPEASGDSGKQSFPRVDASKTSSEVFACFATAKNGRRGTGPILMAFSVIGILIGLFLINHGLNGNGLSSTITLILGIFVTIKEIIDAFH